MKRLLLLALVLSGCSSKGYPQNSSFYVHPAIHTGKVKVSWVASAGATGYIIKASSDGGATYTVVGSAGATATSLTITGLTKNTKYVFKVAAVSTGGISAYSALVGATP